MTNIYSELVAKSKLPRTQIKAKYFPLEGGEILTDPALSLAPGNLLYGKNYESYSEGGYRRIDGFERYDGKAKPSEIPYYIIDFKSGTESIPKDTEITGAIGGATAVTLVDAVLESGTYAGGDAKGHLAVALYYSGASDYTTFLPVESGSTLAVDEGIQVSGSTKMLVDVLPAQNAAGTDAQHETYRKAAIELARGKVQKVPGTGEIRGVWVYRGDTYAFRDSDQYLDSDGKATRSDMYRSYESHVAKRDTYDISNPTTSKWYTIKIDGNPIGVECLSTTKKNLTADLIAKISDDEEWAGFITSLSITNGGSSYSSVPTVSVKRATPLTGSFLTTVVSSKFVMNTAAGGATISLEEGGVYTFDVSNSSNSSHVLAFSSTADGTHASGTELTTGIVRTGTPGSTPVSSTTITAGGSAYTSAPAVTFSAPPSGGTQATGTAVVTSGAVTGITITNAGAGYTDGPPTITFSGGGGTGATATATVVHPTVVFTVPTGQPTLYYYCTAHSGMGGQADTPAETEDPEVIIKAEVTSNEVSSLILINGGKGFASAPVITISGGGGSGATATGTIATKTRKLKAVATIAPADDIEFTARKGGLANAFSVDESFAYTTSKIASDLQLSIDPENDNRTAKDPGWDKVELGKYVKFKTGTGDWTDYWTAVGQSSGAQARVRRYLLRKGAYSPPEAVGTIVLDRVKGPIQRILVPTSGENYTAAPTVTITEGGGTGCTASSTIATDKVITAHMTATGVGYTSPPVVSITGGDGVGAEGTAVIGGGVVRSILITNQGSGYTSDPTITLTGGGGSGATADSRRGGSVTSVSVSTKGSGYYQTPTVTFTGGLHTNATATCTVSGGAINVVTMTDNGSGYVSDPTVTFTGGGGSGATATVLRYDNMIQDIVMTSNGTGYTSAPTITITGGGGSGAVAEATYGFEDSENLTRQGDSTVRSVTDGLVEDIINVSGGRYEFVNYNFTGAEVTARMYGCDGKNPAFEWDGSVYIPIYTGMTNEAPMHITAHKTHLFLSFPNGSVQHSGIGKPFSWDVITGAIEIGTGDDVTGFQVLPSDVLAVFNRNRTYLLYGTSVIDWNLTLFTDDSGAIEHTVQRLTSAIYLDDRGITDMLTVNAFGDFRNASISRKIQPFIDSQRGKAISSLRVRNKNQYRLYFNDGTGIHGTFVGAKPTGFIRVNYGMPVRCCCSAEKLSGDEILFFGSDDGYVYELDKGTSFDGTSIEAMLRLNYYHYESPTHHKRFRKVHFEMTADSNVSLKFQPDFSYGDADVPEGRLVSLSVLGGGGFWDISNWNEFNWSGQVVSTSEENIDGVGNNMGILVISDATYENPHILQGVTVHYSVRRIRR